MCVGLEVDEIDGEKTPFFSLLFTHFFKESNYALQLMPSTDSQIKNINTFSITYTQFL